MTASKKPHCITESRTDAGLWWRYTHSKDEPNETIEMAIRIAAEVAAGETRQSGNTYVVASTPQPAAALYVFACDHPDAAKAGINVMFEFTPEGERIRRPGVRAATRH